MKVDKRAVVAGICVLVLLLAFAIYKFLAGEADVRPKLVDSSPTLASEPTIALSDAQAQAVKVVRVGQRTFTAQKRTVGSIDFDENRSVQVYSPYQGRIIDAFGNVGDNVKKGQVLFTIESPDLLTAESTLISAAGVLELQNAALERARKMFAVHSAAQKDLEQAVSDQATADAAFKSARDAVLIFGKTPEEIDGMVKTRRVEPKLIVRSPIAGRITARSAQPGLLVQPGNAPAPFAVADMSTLWMLANVPEIDAPIFKIGQRVKVSVMAYGDQVFEGRISTLGQTVDPNAHTIIVRSEISDPNHFLRPGMLATFTIYTGSSAMAPSVPAEAVVREGDGTMTVWVTADGHRFTQCRVQVGLTADGNDQIISGLRPGELVATEGAVFLDNMITADVTD